MTAFLLLAMNVAGPAIEPAELRLDPPSGPYYVNQSIRAEVPGDWPAGSRLDAPEVPGLTAVPIPNDGGDALGIVLVPGRAGRVLVPPLRVLDADGTLLDATPRGVIEARSVPVAGRPTSFYGGVGPFEITTEMDPTSLITGRMTTWTVTIRGDATRGRWRVPDATTLLGADLAETILVEGFEASQDPVAGKRIWRLRLRPVQPGSFLIPGVSVSSFLPGARRFETRRSQPSELVVRPPPQFRPDTRIIEPEAQARGGEAGSPGGWPRSFGRPIALAVGILVAVLAGILFTVRRIRSRPKSVARRLARMRPGRDPVETATRIEAGVARYLDAFGIDRPASPTPPEVEDLARSAGVAPRSARRLAGLVAACHAIRYGRPRSQEGTGGSDAPSPSFAAPGDATPQAVTDQLCRRARAVFRSIG